MSCRHWLVTIQQEPTGLHHDTRSFSVIRDCETKTYRLWCDDEDDLVTNCVDLTVEKLSELRDKLSGILESHGPWPQDD